MTPMSGGVRAAGLVELGGTCAPPVPERFGQLEDYTRWMLKDDAVAALGERDKGQTIGLGSGPRCRMRCP